MYTQIAQPLTAKCNPVAISPVAILTAAQLLQITRFATALYLQSRGVLVNKFGDRICESLPYSIGVYRAPMAAPLRTGVRYSTMGGAWVGVSVVHSVVGSWQSDALQYSMTQISVAFASAVPGLRCGRAAAGRPSACRRVMGERLCVVNFDDQVWTGSRPTRCPRGGWCMASQLAAAARPEHGDA